MHNLDTISPLEILMLPIEKLGLANTEPFIQAGIRYAGECLAIQIQGDTIRYNGKIITRQVFSLGRHKKYPVGQTTINDLRQRLNSLGFDVGTLPENAFKNCFSKDQILDVIRKTYKDRVSSHKSSSQLIASSATTKDVRSDGETTSAQILKARSKIISIEPEISEKLIGNPDLLIPIRTLDLDPKIVNAFEIGGVYYVGQAPALERGEHHYGRYKISYNGKTITKPFGEVTRGRPLGRALAERLLEKMQQLNPPLEFGMLHPSFFRGVSSKQIKDFLTQAFDISSDVPTIFQAVSKEISQANTNSSHTYWPYVLRLGPAFKAAVESDIELRTKIEEAVNNEAIQLIAQEMYHIADQALHDGKVLPSVRSQRINPDDAGIKLQLKLNDIFVTVLEQSPPVREVFLKALQQRGELIAAKEVEKQSRTIIAKYTNQESVSTEPV